MVRFGVNDDDDMPRFRFDVVSSDGRDPASPGKSDVDLYKTGGRRKKNGGLGSFVTSTLVLATGALIGSQLARFVDVPKPEFIQRREIGYDVQSASPTSSSSPDNRELLGEPLANVQFFQSLRTGYTQKAPFDPSQADSVANQAPWFKYVREAQMPVTLYDAGRMPLRGGYDYGVQGDEVQGGTDEQRKFVEESLGLLHQIMGMDLVNVPVEIMRIEDYSDVALATNAQNKAGIAFGNHVQLGAEFVDNVMAQGAEVGRAIMVSLLANELAHLTMNNHMIEKYGTMRATNVSEEEVLSDMLYERVANHPLFSAHTDTIIQFKRDLEAQFGTSLSEKPTLQTLEASSRTGSGLVRPEDVEMARTALELTAQGFNITMEQVAAQLQERLQAEPPPQPGAPTNPFSPENLYPDSQEMDPSHRDHDPRQPPGYFQNYPPAFNEQPPMRDPYQDSPPPNGQDWNQPNPAPNQFLDRPSVGRTFEEFQPPSDSGLYDRSPYS